MFIRGFVFSCFSFFFLFPQADSSEISDKSARYYKLLLKRPESSTLFERFVNSWLDEGSKEELEAYLKTEALAGNFQQWRLLGSYYEWTGQEDDALKALDTAIEQSPEELSLYTARAKLKARLLDFEGALQDLTKAGDAIGEEAATLRGTWLARAGRPEEAVAAWKDILAKNPDDEELREDLIELEVGEGLYDEAITTLQELIADTKDPYQKALRTMRLANIHGQVGNSEDELNTYRKLLDKTGEGSWLEREILAQVENTFRREDNLTGLRDFYQNLREDFPQRVSLRKGLAQQMALNGETEEAIALFREILKITPGNRANREQFINLLEGLEEYALANEELDFLLRDQPNDETLLEHQARLYSQIQNQEELTNTLARLKNLREGKPTALLATADLYQRYKLLTEAEELLRETNTKFPENLEAKEALATFLAEPENEAKSQEEATQIWLSIAEQADAEGLLSVARSLQNNRRSEECFQLLTSRISEFPNNTLLLTQLCRTALETGHERSALPHALHLASLAKAPTEFESALNLIARLGRRLDLDETIQELLRKENKTIAEWCALSELQTLFGDFQASANALDQARKLDDSILVASQQVRFFESQGKSQEAISKMRELIASPGGNRPVYLSKLITLLLNANKLDDALVEVEEWKKIAPGDKQAWIQRADLLTQLGRLDDTVQELRRALAKFDADLDLRDRLAQALIRAGDYLAGERIYKKLYEEAEDNSSRNRWITELASLAQQEGRTEELLADFERRKRQSPKETSPLLALARIHEVLNQYDERHEALAEALRRRPQDFELRSQIAKLEEQAGLHDQAASTLREGLALTSGPKARQELAAFYLRTGEFELGLDLTLSLEANDPNALESTALSLCKNGEWQIAYDYLSDIELEDPRLNCIRALALFQLKRREQAIPLMSQLLSETTPFSRGQSITSSPQFKQQLEWQKIYNPQMTERELLLNAFINSLYQVNHWGNRQHHYGYMSQGNILPSNLEELASFTFALLIRESSNFPNKDERKKFFANFSFPQDIYHQSRIHTNFEEWAIAELESGRLELHEAIPHIFSVDLLKERFEVAAQDPNFITAHPSAAFHATQRLYSTDSPEGKKWFQRGLKILSKVEDSEQAKLLNGLAPQLLLTDAHNYYRYINKSEEATYGDEQRKIFREFLHAELANHKEEDKSLYEQQWFHLLLQDAFTRNDATQYLKLLNIYNQEHENFLSSHKNQKGRKVFYNGYFYNPHRLGYAQNEPASAPPFPPRDENLAPAVLQNFAMANPYSRGRNQPSSEKQLALLKKWREQRGTTQSSQPSQDLALGLSPEDFAPFIPEIENEIIQALAWHWVKDETKVAETIQEFAGSNDPSKLLLAAGYAAQQKNDLSQSFEILSRLSNLALEKEQRQRIDSHLAFLGSQLQQKEKLTEEQLLVAQRAALRYRRTSNASQNLELTRNILKALGLEKQTAKKRRNSQNRYQPNSYHHRNYRQAQNDIGTLIGEGKQEQAANLAFKELKSAYRRSKSFTNSQARNILEVIKADEKLRESVLAIANPKESRSLQRRLFFAELSQALENTELARKHFAKLAEEYEHDPRFRSKLLALDATTNPQNLHKKIEEGINSEEFASLIWSLLGNENPYRVEKQLGTNFPLILELATAGLNQLDAQDSFDASLTIPLQVLRLSIGQGYFGENEQMLPSLATADADTNPERIQLVNELIKACLRHPQLALITFEVAEGCKKSLGLNPEELARIASGAVKASQNLTFATDDQMKPFLMANPWAHLPPGTQNWHSSQRPKETGLSARAFLTATIIRNNLSPKSSEYSVLANSDEEEKEMLETLLQLANADQNIAQQAYDTWKNKLPTEVDQRLRELRKACLILSTSGKELPLLETLQQDYLQLTLNQWERSFFENWQLQQRGFHDYLANLWDAEKPQKLTSTLQAIASYSLGEEHSGLIPEFGSFGQQHSLPGELQQIHETFEQIARELLRITADLTLYKHLSDIPAISSCIRSYHIREILRNQYSHDSAEKAWKQFQAINIEQFSFETLGKPFVGDDDFFLQVVANHFRNTKNSELLTKEILAQKEDSVKKLLFLSHLRETDESRTALLEALSKNTESLLQLSKVDQEGLGELLQKPFPLGKSEQADTQTKELLRILNKERFNQQIEKIETLIAEGFVDVQNNSYRTVQEVATLMSTAFPVDSELAIQLGMRLLRDLDESSQSLNNHSNPGYNPTLDGFEGILGRFDDNNISLSSVVKFLSEVDQDSISDNFPALGYDYDIRRTTDQFTKNLPKREELSDIEEKLFSNWHWEDFAKALPADPHLNKIAHYIFLGHQLSNFRNRNLKDYFTWDSESKFNEQHPLSSKVLRLCLAESDWKALSAEQKESSLETWRSLISDESISPRIRMGLVCAASDRASRFMCESNLIQATLPLATKWAQNQEHVITRPFLEYLECLTNQNSKLTSEELQGFCSTSFKKFSTSASRLIFDNFSSKENYARSMAHLALKCRDVEAFRVLTKEAGESFRGNLNTLLALAESSEGELINRLLAREGKTYSSASIRWEPESAEHINKLLTLVEDPHDRYRLECELSTIADGKLEEGETIEKRQERLLRLAKQFSELGPKAQVAQIECLDNLTSNPANLEILEVLRKPLAEIGQRWNHTQTLNKLGEIPINSLRNLLNKHIYLELREGNWEEFLKHGEPFIALLKGNRNRSYDSARGASALFWGMKYGLLTLSANSEEPVVNPKILEFSLQFLEAALTSSYQYRDLNSAALAFAYLAHSEAGKSEDLLAWIDALEGRAESNYTSFDKRRILDRLSDSALKNESRNLIRKELFHLLTKDKTISRKLFPFFKDFSFLCDRIGLKQSEVCEWLTALPEDYPRKGELLLEFANRIALRDKKFDQASPLYDQAIALAKSTDDNKLLTRINAWLAYGMKRVAEKENEAFSLFKTLDLSIINQKDRKRFEKEFAALKKNDSAPKENQEPATVN